MKKSERIGYSSVDGMRAITHIGLVALHVAILTTAHLPSRGELWDIFRKHPLYTFSQAGAIQVDVSFMISGFLLVDKLLFDEAAGKKPETVLKFVINRALRMIGPIMFVSLMGLCLGDTWDKIPNDPSLHIPASTRLLATWTFILNYLPATDYGSFSTSLCWSCCVDIQVQTVIFCLFCLLRKLRQTKTDVNSQYQIPQAAKTQSGVHGEVDNVIQGGCGYPRQEEIKNFTYILRWMFFALIIVSIAIRAMVFEESTLNIVRVGQFSHLGLLMSNSSYTWLYEHYGKDHLSSSYDHRFN
jgi:peptidoglycan/LPS O-acetylase OafA/YrhL